MKQTKLALIVVGLVLCNSLGTFAANVKFQPIQKSADAANGEVDKLLKELKEHNQPVVRRCLDNCHEASTTDAPKLDAVEKSNIVQPNYPPIARAAHATGEVVVMVVIDEEGKVIAAQALSGHPLLQAASVKAARESTFAPTLLDGQPVKVTGNIVYRFIL